MTSRPGNLPLLPGMSFENKQSKARHGKVQHFNHDNGVQQVRGESEGAHKKVVSSQAAVTTENTQPAWLVFDRTTLVFDAFFKEAVHERREEHFRVRNCKIYFFPEDDTIEVIEPTKSNSGLAQGKLVRRHRIPSQDGESTYTVRDLNVGKELHIYGRVYRIINCDKFTRSFLAKLGITAGEAEAVPKDAYTDLRETQKKNEQPLRPYDKQDKLAQFLTRDRQVLRFYAVWDDSVSECGEKRYMVVHYYLADDTVEVREVAKANSGRDGNSTFLSRCKLPKDASVHVKQPGAVTARTLLNVTGRDGTHVLDSLHTGSGAGDHYTERDLMVGEEILVFNRPLLLCDCDEFTKEYYREMYGIEEFSPINVDPDDDVTQFIDNGKSQQAIILGDSMSKLTFDTPKPDVAKWFQNGSASLQFRARLDTANPVDADRTFVVTFYLSDDTISVFEDRKRNSGIAGGKFIERKSLRSPDGSRVLTPYDFCMLGERVTLNSFPFVLTGASEFTFNYMQDRDFPGHNVQAAVAKAARNVEGSEGDLKGALDAAAVAGSDGELEINFDDCVAVLESAAGLSYQEAHTVARNARNGSKSNAVDFQTAVSSIFPTN